MSAFINLENVFVRFRIYHNVSPSLREFAVNLLSGKKDHDSYTDFHALNDISLKINVGDRVGIVGLNGAGKSTLLKTIAGIYSPHQGRVRVRGRLTPLMELGAGFNPEQTGRQNIYLNGALLGISPQEMKEQEQAIADFSELSDFLDMPIKYYSSGMYGRLAFSIAAMTNPEILMIDEVFATGDGHFVQKSTQRVEQMVAQSSILIVVSHSIDQISRLCNRVILLDHGKLINDGETENILAQYQEQIASLNQGG
jgi:ABC-type polysaccharide/polyol phosphate transport system ATPase subunit